MVTLALLPSASVALVVARSASHGVRDGIAAAMGIVAGDLIFVICALLGMTVLAATIGDFFSILKYAGGAYLIWMGLKLLRSPLPASVRLQTPGRTTLLSSFSAGLLLTLGDMKAIFFYASLFPALTNPARLSATEITAIILTTMVTVGGVKVAYACAASGIVRRLKGNTHARHTQNLAGSLMIGAGSYVLIKS